MEEAQEGPEPITETIRVASGDAQRVRGLASALGLPHGRVVEMALDQLEQRVDPNFSTETVCLLRELQLLTLRTEQLIESNLVVAEALIAIRGRASRTLITMALEARAELRELNS